MAYSNFTNNSTNVQFFSGTQANLTPYIQGTTNAIEGAFYVTTDTQKLYIGRKNSSDNKIYAVQVSRGITFVQDSGDLPTVSANSSNNVIEEGEFYYIISSNVLATLREKLNNGVSYNPKQYEWIQINPPTGINSIDTSATLNENIATVTHTLGTDAGDQRGDFKIAGGSNITLTVSNDDTGTQDVGTVTIAATDTTYGIGTTATASGTTDGAKIGLKKNGGNSLDSEVSITGSGTVAVTSDANGNIDVHGPSFTGISVEGKANNGGMTISLEGTDGDGTALSASGTVDPLIEYGTTGNKSTAHFQKVTRSSTDYIIADLDVYTKAQADSAISDAITSQLATANAMTYRGVVTSFESLRTSIVANGGAHNGDVYKVGAITDPFAINGVSVDVGDLIILTGTEAETGTYAGQILISGSPVTASTTDAQLIGTSSVDGICELVPSGDEPEVTADTQVAAAGGTTEATAPRFTLYDGKNNGETTSTNILTTRFISGNKITVKGATASNPIATTGKDLALTIEHQSTSRTDSTTETLQNNGTANAVLTKAATNATDTIGTDGYELFVFSDPTQALTTDAYGHVTGLKGKKIVYKHNKISTVSTDYSASNGTITMTLTDLIGNTANPGITVQSSTLSVRGTKSSDSLTDPDRLSIDLVWQTF